MDKGRIEVDEDVLLKTESVGFSDSLCTCRTIEVEEQTGFARGP
jgi:hypothetical protein